VPDNITFYKLHRIIQDVFGWQDYHLFEFDCKGICIGKPDKEHEEMIEWAGGGFDPERFDIEEVNKILAMME